MAIFKCSKKLKGYRNHLHWVSLGGLIEFGLLRVGRTSKSGEYSIIEKGHNTSMNTSAKIRRGEVRLEVTTSRDGTECPF